MDENNNHSKDFLNSQANVAKQKDIYSKEVLNTLNTEERFVNYFNQFEDSSVKLFKNLYVQYRTNWHFNPYNKIDFKNRINQRFYKLAITALKNIQLKKLFNVMSSWMNKECNFPDIEVSIDWEKWCKKPLSCPHIEPIQLHEIECYKDFINQLEDTFFFAHMYINLSPMSFVEDKELKGSRWEGEYGQEEYYGRWFTFFDQRYGTSYFKLKPGTRVTNEYKYIWHYQKTIQENAPQITPPEILPTISIYSNKDEFVNLFEDKEFKQLYKAYSRWKDELRFAEDIDMDIIYLCEAKEIIPIEDNDDWREGISIASDKYCRNKTIQILEDVFDEYLILRTIDEGFDEWEESHNMATFTTHDEHIKKIFNGRKLMGEPEDLNF
jgi:hypothetical protein